MARHRSGHRRRTSPPPVTGTRARHRVRVRRPHTRTRCIAVLTASLVLWAASAATVDDATGVLPSSAAPAAAADPSDPAGRARAVAPSGRSADGVDLTVLSARIAPAAAAHQLPLVLAEGGRGQTG